MSNPQEQGRSAIYTRQVDLMGRDRLSGHGETIGKTGDVSLIFPGKSLESFLPTAFLHTVAPSPTVQSSSKVITDPLRIKTFLISHFIGKGLFKTGTILRSDC